MKKEISPVLVVAAIVVLVAVLGYFGYRASQPEPVQGMDKSEFQKRMGDYANASRMGGGGGGMGGGYPGGPGGRPIPPGGAGSGAAAPAGGGR